MKKNFLIVMCLMMALMASAQDLVVCSYNIRNANRGDAKNGNGWEKRSVYMCQQIQFEDPGVFGCQEVKKEQIDDMLRLMPEYAYVGVGREDGKEGANIRPYSTRRTATSCWTAARSGWPKTPPRQSWDGTPPASACAHGATSRTSRPSIPSISSTPTWTTSV